MLVRCRTDHSSAQVSRFAPFALRTDHRWVFGFAHALPSFSGLSISGLSRGSGAGQHRRRLADRTVAHAHRLCLACRALFAGSHCCLHTVTPAPPSSSSSMSFSRLLSGRRPGTCPDRLNSTTSARGTDSSGWAHAAPALLRMLLSPPLPRPSATWLPLPLPLVLSLSVPLSLPVPLPVSLPVTLLPVAQMTHDMVGALTWLVQWLLGSLCSHRSGGGLGCSPSHPADVVVPGLANDQTETGEASGSRLARCRLSLTAKGRHSSRMDLVNEDLHQPVFNRGLIAFPMRNFLSTVLGGGAGISEAPPPSRHRGDDAE